MTPNWPELWEREPGLRPEALGKPGELQFNAVWREGFGHVGIPWARSLLTKEPDFTIRHCNDIDMAQSQLRDARAMLERACAALCEYAAVRFIVKNGGAIGMDDGDRACSHPRVDGPDLDPAALFAACQAILDERDRRAATAVG